jgi:protein-S-isoprenylcysteine O-methyltransferase Ste14
MKRYLILLYGIVAYLVFFVTILYAIGFTGNLVVSKTIDGNPQVSMLAAIGTNTALLLLFALQHSIMPRSSFKRRLANLIPAPIERSSYVLMASFCLVLIMWLWQPMNGTIWHVNSLAGKGFLQFFFFLGWGLVFISTLLMNHLDVFGLRQVWFYFNDKPYQQLTFRTPLFYRFVRHPLYLGFVLAFWCTPVMTTSHLLFAIICTGYILTALQFEERGVVKLKIS